MPAPQGRKPQGRNREKGDGPTHRGEERSYNSEERSAIERVRTFGIDNSKLSDNQIVTYLDTRGYDNQTVTMLIEEFYTKGRLPDEFETVKKKEKKKKPVYERSEDYNSSGKGEREGRSQGKGRGEPRPRQTEDKRNKPAPRPAAQPARAKVAPAGAWGNGNPAQAAQAAQAAQEVSQPSASQPSWAVKEPAAQAAPEPIQSRPAPVSTPSVGVKSWAQVTKVKSPPPPAPPPAPAPAPLQKLPSPPPSPQLDAEATNIVDKMADLMSDQPSSAHSSPPTQAEPEPPAVEAPKPVSIGEPAQTYSAPAAGTSVWGSVAKDPSLSSTASEFVPPAVQVPAKQQSPNYAQPSSSSVPSVGRADFGASASGTPFIGAPQGQSYGSSSGLYGSGFVQSLSSVGDDSAAAKDQMPEISFGAFGAGLGLGDDNNPVASYSSTPSVEIPASKPKPKKSQPEPEYPSSSGMENSQSTMQQDQFGGFNQVGGYVFTGMEGGPYGGEPLSTQYGGQEYGQPPSGAAAADEGQQGHSRGYNKGNNRADKGQSANGAPKGQQASQQQPQQQQQMMQQMHQQF